MYPPIHPGHNSEIGVNLSNFNTNRTSEAQTRRNQRKKLRNRTMNSNIIINDPNLIRYPNLLTNEFSWYPRLNRNVQYLLQAMNIDIHLGHVLCASISESQLWNMLSLDPVEVFRILFANSGNDSPQKSMLPSQIILPIVL